MISYKFILSFFLCLFISLANSQEAIRCNIIFNTFDKLVELNDTLGAIKVIEDCENCEIYKSIYRHDFTSSIYFEKGMYEKAKNELVQSVEKGLFLNFSEPESFWNKYREINDKYGSDFALSLIKLQEQKLSSMSEADIEIRNKLISIHERDQSLRKKTKYKSARSYEFIYKLYGDKEDDEKIHNKNLELAKEFREKDSLVLLEFINLSSDLGFVPDSGAFMFNDISTLMCHTSHIKFENDIDKLYYDSVVQGTISPKFYAWYKGYNEEYFGDGKTFSYYFTHGKDLIEEANFSEDDIISVNKKRSLIGLPHLPKSIWSKEGLR